MLPRRRDGQYWFSNQSEVCWAVCPTRIDLTQNISQAIWGSLPVAAQISKLENNPMFSRVIMLLALAGACVCLGAIGVGSVAMIFVVGAVGLMAALAGLIAWPFLRTSTSTPQHKDTPDYTGVGRVGKAAKDKPVLGSTPQCQSEHSV